MSTETTELELKTLKPGILVVPKVSLKGGITYDRKYEESYFEEASEIRKWSTTSVILNKDERNEGTKIQSGINSSLQRVCAKTPVGFICHKDAESELEKVLNEIKTRRDEFNKKATTCILKTNIACFEVKSDNTEVLLSIIDQITDVANDVRLAITRDAEATLKLSARRWLQGMNPEEIMDLPDDKRDALVARARAELIRKSIGEIRNVEKLLPEEAGDEAKKFIKQSRKIARTLCNNVEKHHIGLEEVLNKVDLSGVKRTRAAFVKASINLNKPTISSEAASLVPARKVVHENQQETTAG